LALWTDGDRHLLDDLQHERRAATSTDIIHQWVGAYKMKSRLAFAPSALEETKTKAVGYTHAFISHTTLRYSRHPVSYLPRTSVQSTTDMACPPSVHG
jgi:hypothetical protein